MIDYIYIMITCNKVGKLPAIIVGTGLIVSIKPEGSLSSTNKPIFLSGKIVNK